MNKTTSYAPHTNQKPEAWITVNKDRRPIEDGQEVYLKDGQRFEIELNNPTEDPVLAKLKIQGETSDSGLVLRPGEHTFLKRYIGEDKAFRFGTYEVPKENKRFIEKNGEVAVKFYEKEFNFYKQRQITWNPPKDYPDKKPINPYPWERDPWTAPNSPRIWMDTSSSISFSGDVTISSSSKDGETLKTGRVEPGEKTGQNFNVTNEKFRNFSFHTVRFNLLPTSEKKSSRKYCTECGAKQKKNWKFCAYCGTKFE
jgi:hypothetical protein